MDHSKSFEVYKVRRFIQRWGKDYTFKAPKLNQFKEPTGEDLETVVRGVFYENNEYMSLKVSEGATVRSKPNPRILCMAEEGPKISQGMSVEIVGTTYRVTGVRDVDKLEIACDISLEEVVSWLTHPTSRWMPRDFSMDWSPLGISLRRRF